MARIRSIKPEFWADEFLAERCTRDARMLYLALWNLADEHGRCRGGGRYLKGQVFAYDDDITPADAENLVSELVAAGRVQRYGAGSETYLYLPKLSQHQRLEPAKVASRLPEPPTADVSEDLRSGDNPPGPTQIFSDESAPLPGESALCLLPVAGSREQVAGLPPKPTAQTSPPSGGALVKEHLDAMSARPPNRVVGQTAKIVGELLAEGVPEGHIRAGLSTLRAKSLNPSTLPSLVNESMNPPQSSSTTRQRVNAGKDLVETFARREGLL